MKITDMNKEELVAYMKNESHEIGLPDGRFRFNSDSHTWKRAFQLIKKSGYENLEMDCPKCVDKVAKWLVQ